MSKISFDLVIIGAGPAGYVAAIRAAQLGLGKIAIIEKEHVGGICLNWGCIPTKALLKTADLYNNIKKARKFGIDCTVHGFHMSEAVNYSRSVVNKLTAGVHGLIRKNQISLIEGKASIVSNNSVNITHTDGSSQKIDSKNIIIATGAKPRSIPSLKIDHKTVLDYKDAMLLSDVPKSILIVGSGAIGVEYASFYSSVGSHVTLIEKSPRILGSTDISISDFMRSYLIKQKVDIHCGVELIEVDIKENGAKVVYEVSDSVKGTKIQKTGEFEKILIAVGVTPNTDGIGLKELGLIKNDGDHIHIDEYMRTEIPGIHAIGDVTKMPLLAHKASHQGIICVEKIAGLNIKPIDYNNIPNCIYSYPEIATVGYTEEEAVANGYNISVGLFPHVANGKAIATDATDGMTKIIFDKDSGELLGAHLIGLGVTEMIYGIVVAKSLETTYQELIHSIYPHPTISESIHEAALSAYNRALHI